MNQENYVNPTLLDLFENYFNQNLTKNELEEFRKRLMTEDNFKTAYDGYLLSRAAINEKIENQLKQDLKKWQNELSSKPETKVFTLFRWKSAIAACIIGLVSLTAIQNYRLNNFIDKQIDTNLLMDMASRSDDQNKVEKIISENRNDKPKTASILEKISVLDPEYGHAQKWLGINAVKNGDCKNTKKYLTDAKESQQDVSLAVILCHIKCNQFDAEFEAELNAILSDPDHNNYKVALEIKNKMSSIWWKILK